METQLAGDATDPSGDAKDTPFERIVVLRAASEYIDKSFSNFGKQLFQSAAANIDSTISKHGGDFFSDSEDDEDDEAESTLAPLPSPSRVDTSISSDDVSVSTRQSEADTVVADNTSRNRSNRRRYHAPMVHVNLGSGCGADQGGVGSGCHVSASTATAASSAAMQLHPFDEERDHTVESTGDDAIHDTTDTAAASPDMSIDDIVNDLEGLKATVLAALEEEEGGDGSGGIEVTRIKDGSDEYDDKDNDGPKSSLLVPPPPPPPPPPPIDPFPEDDPRHVAIEVAAPSYNNIDKARESSHKSRRGRWKEKKKRRLLFAGGVVTLILVVAVICIGFTVRPAPPAPAPTSDTTASSTEGGVATKLLVYLGSDGPFDLCEGDCDADDDCVSGSEGEDLVCYRRDGFDPVPGCDGAGKRDVDYCVSKPQQQQEDSGMGVATSPPNEPPPDEPTPSPSETPTLDPTPEPTASPKPTRIPTVSTTEAPPAASSTTERIISCAELSSESFQYVVGDDENEVVSTSCLLLSLRGQDTEEMCNRPIVDFGDGGGDADFTVRTLCPLMCGDCEGASTSFAPTSMPTVSPTLEPEVSQSQTFSFYVMGDIPYSTDEEDLLRNQLDEISDGIDQDDALFMIHVGDVFSSKEYDCEQSTYSKMGKIFTKKSPLPVIVLPGDGDWSDCPDPDTAWKYWTDVFLDFEQNWDNVNGIPSSVVRSTKREENFALAHAGVLFIGINTGGATYMDDPDEYSLREEQCYKWAKQTVKDYTGETPLRAVFVFGHVYRFHIIHEMLSDDLSKKRGIPTFFFHGDGLSWDVSQPYDDLFWEIEVDRGGNAPPIKVTVRGASDEERFQPENKDQFMFAESIKVDRRGGLY